MLPIWVPLFLKITVPDEAGKPDAVSVTLAPTVAVVIGVPARMSVLLSA